MSEAGNLNSTVPVEREDCALLQLDAVETLELWHHYTVKTCFTMTDNFALRRLRLNVIQGHAFRHHCLLDGLLAIAALHCHRIGMKAAKGDFLVQARIYQQRSLQAYIPLLHSINEENCHALFACAIVLSGTSFAFLQDCDASNTADKIIDGLISVFDLLLGAVTIANQAELWLQSGDLAPMLDSDLPYIQAIRSSEVGAISTLISILRLVEDGRGPSFGSVPVPNLVAYRSSIQYLIPLLSLAEMGTLSVHSVGDWPAKAGMTYLALLKQKDPWALLILAHYGAVLHKCAHIWFLEGVGAQLISAVSDVLGD